MADVFVYAPNADDFDCLGMCGPLSPTKCVHTEDANGMSEISLEHPIDENKRWSFLQTGYILKAEAPVRTCPEVTEAGAVVTALEKWTVKMSATKGQRYLYSKATGGKKKKLLSPGSEVIVTKKGASRYKAKTRKYSGWIAIDALENKVTQTIPEDPNAIEQVVPAWSVRPQLFRITEAVVSDKGVSVKAEHIFYDLRGNITTYAADNPTCVDALAGILDGCAVAHEFEGYTNMLDTRIIDPWTRVSPVEALLNPEAGLIARWGGELVRDDQEFYVLNRAGMNRGVRIAYGKNLLGVDCTINETDVITRIMPIGQTSKGKPLLLAAGSYTVDGQTVTIDSSLTVAADNADDYPTPHVFVLDVGKEAKAAGTSAAQVLAARVKMIRAALRKFTDEECNLPSVNLKVDFIALGDTAEYAQYRQLEDVYLYDSVRIYHPKIGIDVTAQVNRVEFDCLLERFNGIELGAMRRDMAHTPVATWQVPSGLSGKKFAAESITARALSGDVGGALDLAGNPTVNAAVTQVVVESSAGNVLKGASTALSTTLTARVYRGGIEEDLDASLCAWTRETGDAPADTAWALAHTGMRSVVVTAAEFAAAPAVYHCNLVHEPEDGEADPTVIARGSLALQYQQIEVYKGDEPPENPVEGMYWGDTAINSLKIWHDSPDGGGSWETVADYRETANAIAELETGTILNVDYLALLESAGQIQHLLGSTELIDNLAGSMSFGDAGLRISSVSGDFTARVAPQQFELLKRTGGEDVLAAVFGLIKAVTASHLQVGLDPTKESKLRLGNLVMEFDPATGNITDRRA